MEGLPYWRYETIIEKTNQWFESLKQAKQNRMNDKDKLTTIFDINVNKNPNLWTTN
jgi:hypothetical protein